MRMSCREALFTGIVCLIATRGMAADALARLVACREVQDGAARLACYDRESAALQPAQPPGASPVAPPPQPSPAAAAVQASSPREQFGLPEGKIKAQEVAAGARPADASKIEAHLLGVSTAADGRAVFRLDNDQTWRALAPEGELLARAGDEVTISRGWLGSYWLQLKSGRGCKVTRIK